MILDNNNNYSFFSAYYIPGTLFTFISCNLHGSPVRYYLSITDGETEPWKLDNSTKVIELKGI